MLIPLLVLAAGAAATYAVVTHKKKQSETVPGPIYSIGLRGVPEGASVESVGEALAASMGWKISDIFDGSLDAAPNGDRILTVAFKYDVRSPRMPTVGNVFDIGGHMVSVTFVQQAPASTSGGVSGVGPHNFP